MRDMAETELLHGNDNPWMHMCAVEIAHMVVMPFAHLSLGALQAAAWKACWGQ